MRCKHDRNVIVVEIQTVEYEHEIKDGENVTHYDGAPDITAVVIECWDCGMEKRFLWNNYTPQWVRKLYRKATDVK
jgi:hypothetical protein